jgi:integrase
VFEEPKTRRSRRAVDVPAFLLPYLRRQRAAQASRRERCGSWVDLDLVIDAGDGRPLNPDTLSSGWYRFLKRSGLPHIRFHDLRHAHATLMLLQGVHPKVVSERLGHASVGITLDTYSHVLPSMQTEAVAAFDRLFTAPAAS